MNGRSASGTVPFTTDGSVATAAGKALTVEGYLDQRKARIPDFPHTAPAYDEVTRPTVAPYSRKS